MITFAEALGAAIDVIKEGKKHEHYDRTVKLAKLYWRLMTGEEQDKLLNKFIRREDDLAFEQRVALTISISKPVLNTVLNPFNKVSRSDNVTNILDYGDETKKPLELEQLQNEFWGGDGILKFMDKKFNTLCAVDPNAFLAMTFDSFDGRIENPVSKPVIIPSKDVYNFEIESNELHWVIRKREIDVEVRENKQKADQFILYAPEEIAVFTENKELTSQPNFTPLEDEEERPTRIDAKGKVFEIEYFAHGTPFVPAMRIGYVDDLVTHGETVVSHWDKALPYFMKMLQSVSEMDLTQALHTFPQKISYKRACTGESNNKCDGGLDMNGHTCKVCDGAGWVDTHTSAQDEIVFTLPRRVEDGLMDLDKLMVYKSPPIELLEFQRDWIALLQTDARKAIFNSESFERNDVTATATEKTLDLENAHDTLFDFSEQYSKMYVFITESIASFNDMLDGLEVVYEFSSDFKLKTQTQLIKDLAMANESEAPSFVKDDISHDIARIMYRDDELKLLKFEVKQEHAPFKGKSEAEIMFLLSSPNTLKTQKVLYENMDVIFAEFEDSFYRKPFPARKAEIEAKVEEIMAELDEARVQAVELSIVPNDEDEDEEGQEAS